MTISVLLFGTNPLNELSFTILRCAGTNIVFLVTDVAETFAAYGGDVLGGCSRWNFYQN